MRFEQLEALEKMIDGGKLVDLLDDVETICKVRAQQCKDNSDFPGYGRWDQYAIIIEVCRNMIREEDKRREERKQ